MNLRNPVAAFHSLWDWSPLNGTCGKTIKVTDIDGAIERRQRVLLIETKRPGEIMKNGQRWFYEGIAANGIQVLLIIGETNQPQRALMVYKNTHTLYPCADWNTIRGIVSDWYAWANQQPRLNQRDIPVDWDSALSLVDDPDNDTNEWVDEREDAAYETDLPLHQNVAFAQSGLFAEDLLLLLDFEND